MEIYKVPSYWACALMYGDFTGIEEDELRAIHKFIDETPRYFVTIGEELGFCWRHDAWKYWPYAGDCVEAIFKEEI